jgi:hypothetical protein
MSAAYFTGFPGKVRRRFFRMSRSMRNRAFSFLGRASSTPCSFISGFATNPCLSCPYSATQLAYVYMGRDSLRCFRHSETILNRHVHGLPLQLLRVTCSWCSFLSTGMNYGVRKLLPISIFWGWVIWAKTLFGNSS